MERRSWFVRLSAAALLSAAPQISVTPENVNRDVLLAAMKDHILASVELHVVYTRQDTGARPRDPDQQNGDEQPPPPTDDKRGAKRAELQR